MSISIVASAEEMLKLREDWAVLSKLQRNPLLEFDWHYNCATTLHDNDAINVLVQRDDNDEISAIAPLVILDQGRGHWLEFLGVPRLYEPASMLFRDKSALQSLYRAVARSSHPVLLSRLPGGGDVGSVAPRRILQSGIWVRKESAGTPVLELKSGWEGFYQSISSKRRYDHRRALKNATALGDVSFDVHCPTTKDASQLVDLASEIEDRGWKGRKGSSLRQKDQLGRFFRVYASDVASKGALRLFFQSIGGRPVAMAMCVQKYDALWFLKIGYDEEYRRCSPGIIQLMNIVKYCCEHKISRIEHLGTFEPWLSPWTTYVRPHSTHVHYPPNARGATLLKDDLARLVAKRISAPMNSRRRGD